SDRQGLPLALSEPLAGNHNDLYDIELQFEVVTSTLEDANISIEGLFLNADAGFDAKNFRNSCDKKDINANVCFNKRNGDLDRDEYFDQELYNERYAIERTNAWMDSYRSLLNRYDTTVTSWIGFNYLSFIVIAIKKFKKKN
ncbi:transposase, partial [Aquimarina sp. I32.4]|uniref:transposase n=2 Tax=Aquimarina sp. I32.4 TaxID=2053903 RepID=UPI0011AF724B